MKTRSALTAAAACGAAAVLLVGLDLALNVDVTLEVRAADGTWETAATSKGADRPYASPYGPYGPTCGRDVRLTVHNGMPWSSTVAITYLRNGASPSHQTWTLSFGETRSSEVFHLNGTLAPGGVGPPKGLYDFAVQVDNGFYASVSPCPEATA